MKSRIILKILLTGLGIASAILLAHSAFDIHLDDQFILALKVIDGFVGTLVFPFKLLIVDPIVLWLQQQGLTLELREHWRYAFVLLWLFFASEMRAFASPSDSLKGKEVVWPILNALRWVWAGVVALLGGMLAGLVALDHPSVLWWPVTAYFLLEGGDGFIQAYRNRWYAAEGAVAVTLAAPFAALAAGWIEPNAFAGNPELFWWPVAAFFAWMGIVDMIWPASEPSTSSIRAIGVISLILAAAAVILALGVVPEPEWLAFGQSTSPGLANLAVFVTILAAGFLLYAFFDHDEGEASFFSRVFSDTHARTALDVFTVLGGTTIIIYMAQLVA